VRIISGINRSRKLKTPEGLNTRPTLDQVKEAVFSSLGNSFDSGILFDPFAGSGAIGLEGLSRGMDFCVMNDKEYKAYKCIKENVELLKEEDKCLILNLDYKKAFLEVKDKYKFDWIYLDPPYKKDFYNDCFKLIKEYDLLKEKGIIIAESLNEEEIESIDFIKYKEKKYGIMKVSYFRRGL